MLVVKRVVFGLMAVSAVLFLWMGQEQQLFEEGREGPLSYAQPGHDAPDFEAQTFDDQSFALAEAKGEKGVVLYFWTSWCPYCQASSEAIEKAHQEYGDGVALIGINASHQDRLSEAEQFISRNSLTFTNIIDENGSVSERYYVPPVPATVFINKDGVITYRKTGALTYAELEREIQALRQGEDS